MVVGRRAEPLELVAAATGGLAIVADVGEPDAPQRIVDETGTRFGRLDVLVNNAAVIRNGPRSRAIRVRPSTGTTP